MYRVTSHLLHSRSLLHYCPSIKIQAKAVSKSLPIQKYGRPMERDTCPPPPPPLPAPPKDDRLLWGALSVLVMAGGFAFYAQQNPEVRDWLSLHAPWFDDVIAVLYQENMTYREFAEQCMDDAKKMLSDIDSKPKRCSLHGKPIGPENRLPEEVNKCYDKVKRPKCAITPPPVITKDICEVDTCLRDLGDEIINNYYTAREACAYYNKLVEEKMVHFEMAVFKEVHAASAERAELVRVSLCSIAEASKKIEDLTRYLECGVQAPKESIEATKGMIDDYQQKISASKMQFLWENDRAVELDKQYPLIEEYMRQYTHENETLFPGLDYEKNKLALEGDVDVFLYHAMRYAATLRTQLCDASADATERINRALDTLPRDQKEMKARCAKIGAEVKKGRAEIDKIYNARFNEQKVRNDNILKEALKKQLEEAQATLLLKEKEKEAEATKKLNELVAEKVAAEKKVFADLLSEMAASLKIVEDKLNEHLKIERETRRSQELYSAGVALLAATKKGDPLVRVDKELKAIENASGGHDKLVLTVLKTIPESVWTEGLVPESVLREKYHKMEKTALAVALVDSEQGAPLPIYFLSWIQSLLLFMKLSCIPQKEIDDPPQEPCQSLDTFDLLRRARYYVERGNMVAAVRYVSVLRGAPCAAAAPWAAAARAHVQARQAALALLAHAAAVGLQYV